MPEPEETRRSWFGPVVLLGLGSGVLCVVASTKPWLGTGVPAGQDATTTGLLEGQKFPLASAVGLVLLATWGVLLVTRGVVRRAFALLSLVTAAVLVVLVVVAHQTLRIDESDSLTALLGHRPDVGWTGWFWTAAVASVMALVAGVLAVRLVRRWPEMGRRYDAPTADPASDSVETERDLWHALDEGRDPTAVGDEDTTRDP